MREAVREHTPVSDAEVQACKEPEPEAAPVQAEPKPAMKEKALVAICFDLRVTMLVVCTNCTKTVALAIHIRTRYTALRKNLASQNF
jgi:hypothetical protein